MSSLLLISCLHSYPTCMESLQGQKTGLITNKIPGKAISITDNRGWSEQTSDLKKEGEQRETRPCDDLGVLNKGLNSLGSAGWREISLPRAVILSRFPAQWWQQLCTWKPLRRMAPGQTYRPDPDLLNYSRAGPGVLMREMLFQ